mmetsp:Transcript_78620/g.138614  ORF Transcript_78620/g.138614 Transcript_78620/m.138614 type:complete len:430 (-) Transcript_78620:471-1760(-)
MRFQVLAREVVVLLENEPLIKADRAASVVNKEVTQNEVLVGHLLGGVGLPQVAKWVHSSEVWPLAIDLSGSHLCSEEASSSHRRDSQLDSLLGSFVGLPCLQTELSFHACVDGPFADVIRQLHSDLVLLRSLLEASVPRRDQFSTHHSVYTNIPVLLEAWLIDVPTWSCTRGKQLSLHTNHSSDALPIASSTSRDDSEVEVLNLRKLCSLFGRKALEELLVLVELRHAAFPVLHLSQLITRPGASTLNALPCTQLSPHYLLDNRLVVVHLPLRADESAQEALAGCFHALTPVIWQPIDSRSSVHANTCRPLLNWQGFPICFRFNHGALLSFLGFDGALLGLELVFLHPQRPKGMALHGLRGRRLVSLGRCLGSGPGRRGNRPWRSAAVAELEASCLHVVAKVREAIGNHLAKAVRSLERRHRFLHGLAV